MFGWVSWGLSCFGVVAARLPPCFCCERFVCRGLVNCCVVGVGEVGGGRALVGSGYSDVQIFLGGGSVWGCLVIALGVLRLVCPCSPS